MFKDFGKRLQRDIKTIVDQRLAIISQRAQSNLRNDAQIKSKEVDVNVITHKMQRFAVWFGGSLLADTVIEWLRFILRLNLSNLVIPRHNMKNMDPALLDIIRLLVEFSNKSFKVEAK
jgi:hypothetical protein